MDPLHLIADDAVFQVALKLGERHFTERGGVQVQALQLAELNQDGHTHIGDLWSTQSEPFQFVEVPEHMDLRIVALLGVEKQGAQR